ncbi:MAG: DNA polymerase III subunit alpha [Bdellovibrionaceae bacterium]|nr:DNA polymerase III subunit alpha [Pseudobdellovibrionaceae bacterium]
MDFVHLHVHSDYSLLEGACELDRLVAEGKKYFKAMALTDHGNMYGAIEFYFSCIESGLKPIIGMDAFFTLGSRQERPSHLPVERLRNPPQLVLLAKSYQGYRSLCEMSSISFLEGFYYRPRVDFQTLETYCSDIICLTGGCRGLIYQLFVQEGEESAYNALRRLKDIFHHNLFAEFTRTQKPQEKKFEQWLKAVSVKLGIKGVATNDVHFVSREDFIKQDILYCIGNNLLYRDPHRSRLCNEEYFLKTPQEMKELFSDEPEWIAHSVLIAESINLSFKLKDDQGRPIYRLPRFPTPNGKSLAEHIRDEAFSGFEMRKREALDRGQSWNEEVDVIYRKRLEYELEVIDRMGFNGYFLIVSDFIRWAKSQSIPVGPGRGSGAGSLVAYCLNITDLDPIKHNLLFERFLNPERISMPDFDIDFCQNRRDEVIQYVTEKYSSESVAQIITYGKLQCKAAIKDVGRILGMSFAEVDRVTKLVPEKLGITIQEALTLEPRLTELMEESPEVRALITMAQKVEGMVRHAGIHAAGVIITDGRIRDYAPLARGAHGEIVVQFDMKHAEKIGLIKFDFLGLKTLTLIQYALEFIKTNHGKSIQAKDIPIDDPGIYELMSAGDTLGVFQFEGEGITDAIRKIKPTCFTDITAINGLYRPGPLAMIPVYARRKNGQEPVEYLFEDLKDILQETFGIIVYQEQVMAIASKIAGYSLGEADMLRRAMGKKIKEEMDRQRERFLKGAVARGYDEKKSVELFELMYKFADYGFNKSHAAAYCVIAAQTAWLKRYYPAEFYAGLLTTEISDTDKVVEYVKDAQKHGLVIRPPHVNESFYEFTPIGNEIYFGLGAIKGVGENVAKEILRVRESLPNKKFRSVLEFFENMDSKLLNKKTIESLIKAGALDHLGYSRGQLLTGFPKLTEWALARQKEKKSGQMSLFKLDSQNTFIELPDATNISRLEQLSLEKEVLGFYLSDHPLRGYDVFLKRWTSGEIREVLERQAQQKMQVVSSENKQRYHFKNPEGKRSFVRLGGVLHGLREVVTRKGTRMMFARLEDLSGSVSLVVFPDTYSRYKDLLRDDRTVIVGGFLDDDQGEMKLLVEDLTDLESSIQRIPQVWVMLDEIDENEWGSFFDEIKKRPGSVTCQFLLKTEGATVEIIPDSPVKIALSCEVIEDFRKKIGHLRFLRIPDHFVS